jgi:hypothetical protein
MTPTDSSFLLRKLEPAVAPSYLAPPARQPTAPLEQRPFDELLAEAQAGRLASGRTVSAGFDLSPQELDRLAGAADVAEASGAKRAMLLFDGRALVLDVPTRTISGELSLSSPIETLDAAVYVPAEGEQPPSRPLGPPGSVAPRVVAEQIENA